MNRTKNLTHPVSFSHWVSHLLAALASLFRPSVFRMSVSWNG